MADTFLLEIVTPYRRLLSKEVDTVTAPAYDGEIGVLAGHTGLLTLLKAGPLTYKKGSEVGHIAVGRGYAEVTHEKTVVLVDDAQPSSEMDVQEVKDDLIKAEEELRKLTPDDPAYLVALEAFEFAEARVLTKERQVKG